MRVAIALSFFAVLGFAWWAIFRAARKNRNLTHAPGA